MGEIGYGSELRTAPVKVERIYSDKSGSAVIEKQVNKAETALGKINDPWIKVKESIADKIKNSYQIPRTKMYRVSSSHGRNMTEMAPSKKVVWGGNLPGDIYGDISEKGSSMDVDSGIRIESDRFQYFSLHAWGLMDNSCVGRVIKASEFMRKNGLPTEHPKSISKLKEVYVKKQVKEFGSGEDVFEKMSIEKWEELQVQEVANKAESYKNKPGLEPYYLDSLRTLNQIKEYLDQTDFIVLKRELQVDERLSDISRAAEGNQLKQILGPIFKWLNTATAYRNSGLISDTERPQVFTIEKESIQRYLTEWLPNQMGIYLGRFHNLGLRHAYLHSQNWSAAATVYDLDSVNGSALNIGDTESTEDDFTKDIVNTLDDIASLIAGDLDSAEEFSDVNTDDLAINACGIFLKKYLSQRFKSVTSEKIEEIKNNYNRLLSGQNHDIMNKVWGKMIEDIAKPT